MDPEALSANFNPERIMETLEGMKNLRDAAKKQNMYMEKLIEEHYLPYLSELEMINSTKLPVLLRRMKHQAVPLRIFAMIATVLHHSGTLGYTTMDQEIRPNIKSVEFTNHYSGIKEEGFYAHLDLWQRYEWAAMTMGLFSFLHRLRIGLRDVKRFLDKELEKSPYDQTFEDADQEAAMVPSIDTEEEARIDAIETRFQDIINQPEDDESEDDESEDDDESEEEDDGEIEGYQEFKDDLEDALTKIFGRYYAPQFIMTKLIGATPSRFLDPTYYGKYELNRTVQPEENVITGGHFFYDVWYCAVHRQCSGCKGYMKGRILSCKDCDSLFCIRCVIDLEKEFRVKEECPECSYIPEYYSICIKGDDSSSNSFLGKRESPEEEDEEPSSHSPPQPNLE